MKDAESRFVLIGRSNKSWIAKSDEQSRVLGQAIIKITTGDGKVYIMSEDVEANRNRTIDFFKNHVLNEIYKMKPPEAKKHLEKIEANLVYAVTEYKDVNYAGVVSDNRMLIIPTLNSQNFRDSGMVLELIKEHNPTEFDTYNSDITRIFTGKDNLFLPLVTEAKERVKK